MNETHEAIEKEQAKAQKFFAGLADDIRKPSYGVLQKDFVIALLIRAQEAHLYDPNKESK